MNIAGSRCVDVLLTIDKNFILPSGALIVSLVHNNPDVHFVFHVCLPHDDLKAAEVKLVRRASELCKGAASFRLYDFEAFKRFNEICAVLNKRMATQCARVFLSELDLQSEILLYIDADEVCVGAIDSLLCVEFSEKTVLYASAATHMGNELDVCGCKINGYFFSSMLLINLKLWLELGIEDKTIDAIKKYKPKFPDQDALNIVLNNLWQAVPDNCQALWHKAEDSVFVHFIGEKPWNPWTYNKRENQQSVAVYRQYAKMFEPDVCTWLSFKQDKDSYINFNFYATRKATKWLAKKFKNQHKYKAFISFYLLHIYKKVKAKGIINTILLKSNTRS
ncbi:MAG: hypothetical protein IAB19_00475 [Proteobacteria bacterium]|uniref:Glycosyltransferase family 8 protein n=1 Tax=Candidatus Avisuccinivibrio stercorigallinarum TaxID=2840704 RepID=A0A9D9D7U8_9GAMM|nr:hypothetical protein [Candidatus Avisuccinivibrio stercorigallinarum]